MRRAAVPSKKAVAPEPVLVPEPAPCDTPFMYQAHFVAAELAGVTATAM